MTICLPLYLQAGEPWVFLKVNVHLYADPSTLDRSSPILFADWEGLESGNCDPRAVTARKGKNMILRQ